MASRSETGHAKNVANFNALIQHLVVMGVRYNPAQQSLQLTNLRKVYEDSVNAMGDLIAIKTGFDTVVNQRANLFKQLPKLTTRISATLKVSNVSDKTLDDAAGFIARIRGVRRGVIDEPTGNAAAGAKSVSKRHSVSQKSFDQQYDITQKLLSLINSTSEYQTNESALTPNSLSAFTQQLGTSNQAVAIETSRLRDARMARDKALYDSVDGLVTLAAGIKNYLKSLPGGNSNPDYKATTGLKFVKSKPNVRLDD